MPNKSITLSALNPTKYRAYLDMCAANGRNPLPKHSVTDNGCWALVKPNKPKASGHIAIKRSVNGKEYVLLLHTLSLLHSLAPSVWRDIDAIQANGAKAMACHKPICGGNKACFNPNHLRLDDDAGNTADEIRAGKRVGALNGNAKLTETQVDAIRQEHSDGAKQNALARKYGVSPTAICAIINRKRWAHSDGRLV